jgi:hypothetical protein
VFFRQPRYCPFWKHQPHLHARFGLHATSRKIVAPSPVEVIALN